MILNEQYVRIAKGLLEKTKKQKVPWKPCPLPAQVPPSVSRQLKVSKNDLDAGAFILPLPNSTVLLAFTSPPTEPDIVWLFFLDKEERLAGFWKTEEGDENWPLAFELYQEVSRKVNKWDKVLEEVEEFIK